MSKARRSAGGDCAAGKCVALAARVAVEALEARCLLSGSFPSQFLSVGSNVFFTANQPATGTELWKTDGTAAGTSLVKDIGPGVENGVVSNLTDLNGTLYFTAYDQNNLPRLWKSDGTPAGTTPVSTTQPAATIGSPSGGIVAAAGNRVAFTDGNSVYITDGTSLGTSKIDANDSTVDARELVRAGNSIYYIRYYTAGPNAGTYNIARLSGNPLGKGIGTGTVLRSVPGQIKIFPTVVASGSSAYVQWGSQLIRLSDNTAPVVVTTQPVTDMTDVNGTLYFELGAQLYRTDGTAGNVVQVSNQSVGPAAHPVALGSKVYFISTDGTGNNLWSTAGTPASTQPVTLFSGATLHPQTLYAFNGSLYFKGTDGLHSRALWKSDGTPGGAVMLAELLNYASARPVYEQLPIFASVGSKLVFGGYDINLGIEPWISDGTPAGTHVLKDIAQEGNASGTIRGVVFADTNGNGKQDAGEPPLGGATVWVDSNNNGVIDDTEHVVPSRSDGSFFLGISPGSCVVREIPPSGWRASTPSALTESVVANSTTIANFGNERITAGAKISGAVFVDLNANGVKERSENATAAKLVYLDLNNDGIQQRGEPVVVTDGNGQFSFGGLAVGTYHVRTILQTGWTLSAPTSGVATVKLATNQQISGVLFGETQGLVRISEPITGSIFVDDNHNGVHDPGEALVAGWTVYLDLNNNGALDDGEPSALTQSNGLFSISAQTPGTYIVREFVPPGWVLSPAGEKFSVTFTSGHAPPPIAFGNVQAAAEVSGSVYVDANGDGIQDGPDSGMGGWTVYADLNNNGKLDPGEPSAVTYPNGDYSLYQLAPGTYKVREILQDNYATTSPAFQTVTVLAGKTAAASFGNQQLASIKGTAYNDIDGSGTFNTGDIALPNIKVFLDLNSNGVQDPNEPAMLTDSKGAYSFTHLAIGKDYRVQHLTPAGLVPLVPFMGHFDVVTFMGVNEVVNLGMIKPTTPSTLGGMIFQDVNLDRTRQPNEPGLVNWKLYIDLNLNQQLDPGEPTATTNSAGVYSFPNLKTGRYLIRLIVPAGWRTDNFVAWWGDSVGKPVTNLDFAVTQTARIGGRVYSDNYKNGVLSTGDVVLSGWTVYIDANNNGKLDPGERSTTTTSAGYFFEGLTPGTYIIRIFPQPGYTPTTATSYKVTLTAGQVAGGNDFGEISG